MKNVLVFSSFMILATLLHAAAWISLPSKPAKIATSHSLETISISSAQKDLKSLVDTWVAPRFSAYTPADSLKPETQNTVQNSITGPDQTGRYQTTLHKMQPSLKAPASEVRAPAPIRAAVPTPKKISPQKHQGQRPSAATLTKSERQKMVATWGQEIRNTVFKNLSKIRQNASTTLEITLTKSGKKRQIAITQSTANKTFNAAIIARLKQIDFPPAPQNLDLKEFTFKVPIKFR